MKTTIDFQNRLFDLINSSALKNGITGGVYKSARPITGVMDLKEDVVINCLPVPGDQIQETVGNINIHVKNLDLKIDGKSDKTQPNLSRLNTLTLMAIDIIQDHYAEDFHCDFDSQQLFEEPESNSYYSNIRVNLFSINF